MLINNIHLDELNSPNQTIRARVEIHKGSTLERICTCNDILSQFSVERIGEGKFFGYGICQKLKVDLIDLERELDITDKYTLEATFGVSGDFIYPFPVFHVREVSRDESSNLLSITAYDYLYEAVNHTVSELGLVAPYTIKVFAAACAALLGLPFAVENVDDNSFDTVFEDGANFSGNETIRDALNAIAEATQTIYYINSDWELIFRRLDKNGDSLLTIDKNKYITLKNNGSQVLGKVVHATDLGDNVEVAEPAAIAEGVTQYVRDNPFWSLREDIGTLVESAQAAIGGISINEFNCDWLGNYLLEIGDKIAFTAEDNSIFTSYLSDDVITFNGTLSQLTKWEYEKNDNETAANPSSLGDALNQTFARVDKANKRIQLLVNEVNVTKSATDNEIQIIKENQTTFTQTAEDITLRVESIETTGATKVKTGTGFTFDEQGLRINRDNSGVENLVDNTGMYVKQDGTEVLSANEKGVKAKDLHAVTYLWIGSHSRFEDYEGNRTGCFWIGK